MVVFKKRTMRYLSFQGNSGQTVIEMLVVLAIASMFGAMVVTFSRTANNQTQLFQFVDKFTLDVRRVQDSAYLSQEYNGVDPNYLGKVPCGYGISFDKTTQQQYVVFAAFNSDCSKLYRGEYTLVELERVNLPKLIKFVEVSSNPVIFVPPYPRSIFFPEAQSMTLKLALQGSEQTVFKSIIINKAGQISQVTSAE